MDGVPLFVFSLVLVLNSNDRVYLRLNYNS